MSTRTTPIVTLVPAPVAAPRGARLFGRLLDTGLALYRAVAATRAAHRRAREAAEVRALADTLQRTDPGMAADLRAAADRHLA